MAIWQNGDNSWIQLVKGIQKPPWRNILIVVKSAITGEEEVWGGIFHLRSPGLHRLWICFAQPYNNQQSYGQVDVSVGFGKSETWEKNLGRSSNCGWKLLYDREKMDLTASQSPSITWSLLISLVPSTINWYCLESIFTHWVVLELSREHCGGAASWCDVSASGSNNTSMY